MSQRLDELAILVAIDPGGEHVGVAKFRETPTDTDPGWECLGTIEWTPADLEHQLMVWNNDHLLRPDVLVYESWALYPEMAQTLIGSEMETSQLIGVIKHYARQWPNVDLVAQPASYQQTALGILRSRKTVSVAKKTKSGPHALSAELQGWAAIFRGYRKGQQ